MLTIMLRDLVGDQAGMLTDDDDAGIEERISSDQQRRQFPVYMSCRRSQCPLAGFICIAKALYEQRVQNSRAGVGGGGEEGKLNYAS